MTPNGTTASQARIREVRSKRHRPADDGREVSHPIGDRIVVEVVGRMMEAGAVSVAKEDEGAGALFEHERKVFACHDRCYAGIDVGGARYITGDGSGKRRLVRVIVRHWIAAPVIHTGFGAERAGHAFREIELGFHPEQI